MRYRDIYFDLDGTIIDSSKGVINSALYALRKHNLGNYSVEILKQTLIGPPLFQGLQNLTKINDDDFINILVKDFREEYSKNGVFENELFNDIEQLLELLHSMECNLEILTSKPHKFAQQILKQHDIKKYFSKIDGAGEYDKQSSKIEKLGLSVLGKEKNSIMIGDRIEDIIAGQKNNIDTIAVTYGFDDLNLLREQNPTYIIDNAMDIVKIIKERKIL